MVSINCTLADLFVVEREITNKNAYVFQFNMEKFLVQSKKYMILDVSKVEYLNNTAIKIIVHFAISAKKADKELVIVGNNPSLNEIFDIMKLKNLTKLFQNNEEALTYFQNLSTKVDLI